MSPAPQHETAEIYTNGYDDLTLQFMRRRSLASHGSFIEPFLRPGQHLLDLGCGPGTITSGLAERVTPGGSVLGVDYSEPQLAGARAWAGQLPVTFRAMDVYRLELEDNSFDGVFSHALFEHLAHPADALREAKRVLKNGGFIGLRSPDWGGLVVHPSDAQIQASLEARSELHTRNGGHIHAGRQLADWLRQAGFTSVTVSASYEIYPDNTPIIYHLADQLERNGYREHAATWRRWIKNPHAMFAQAWFAATGYKRN